MPLETNKTLLRDCFSFSHIIQRTEKPYPWSVTEMVKCVGCPELDEQIQTIDSDVHV